MKKIIALTLLFVSLSVSALTLQEARDKGWVEELPTGYIKATNAAAEALVAEVNGKRKQAYEKISKETNAPLEAVGKKAHEKIKEKMGN